ncbi:hypothetical protein MALGJ_05590 [Mycolicibacter algericus]|uniref:Uncharacterized protein n=1 Tax=Mycolicibacter algericus TaxID=1288388 RepID=A0A7I9Y5X5_MYCAL|nr:hypothetical protein MALGJ_05590 [Mycolicibacter algericus]
MVTVLATASWATAEARKTTWEPAGSAAAGSLVAATTAASRVVEEVMAVKGSGRPDIAGNAIVPLTG